MNTIQVVVKEPLKDPVIQQIENDLRTKQQIVGGYIERIPFLNGLDLYLNEEGKLDHLPSNLLMYSDVVVGTIYVEKADNKGRSIGLTDEEAKEAIEELKRHAIQTEKEQERYDRMVQSMF